MAPTPMTPDREHEAAAGLRVYVLTQDGLVHGVTRYKDKAEGWMGLGGDYDYIPLMLEAMPTDQKPVPTVRTAPTRTQENTQNITDQQDELRKRLDKLNKKFQPQSPLLQPQD
jgi:hypothetical protein